MDVAARPRVTVGMPVYNGGQTLRGALESIISQSYKSFKLVISDNASTDSTESICREYASKDKRVTYIRQAANVGAEANFDFLLEKADTEYFMWAAADDVRSIEFVEKNVEFLDSHQDFLGSTCPARFEGADNPVAMGDETRDEPDRFDRILHFFGAWHANGRFYSLFRTDALRKVRFSGRIFLGADWMMVIELLERGKLKRLDSGFVELGRKGVSNSLQAFSRFRVRMICWLIPFFDLSLGVARLFRKARFGQKLRMFTILLKLNLMAFKLQIRFEAKRTYSRFRRTTLSAGLDQVR